MSSACCLLLKINLLQNHSKLRLWLAACGFRQVSPGIIPNACRAQRPRPMGHKSYTGPHILIRERAQAGPSIVAGCYTHSLRRGKSAKHNIVAQLGQIISRTRASVSGIPVTLVQQIMISHYATGEVDAVCFSQRSGYPYALTLLQCLLPQSIMTDPRTLSRNTTFSDTVSAYRCACIHRVQGSGQSTCQQTLVIDPRSIPPFRLLHRHLLTCQRNGSGISSGCSLHEDGIDAV